MSLLFINPWINLVFHCRNFVSWYIHLSNLPRYVDRSILSFLFRELHSNCSFYNFFIASPMRAIIPLGLRFGSHGTTNDARLSPRMDLLFLIPPFSFIHGAQWRPAFALSKMLEDVPNHRQFSRHGRALVVTRSRRSRLSFVEASPLVQF